MRYLGQCDVAPVCLISFDVGMTVSIYGLHYVYQVLHPASCGQADKSSFWYQVKC
jgi:hypothetical protein